MDLKVLPSEKVQLYLLFYKPAPDDPILNRIVAYFDSPFCHVEMALPMKVGGEPWDRVMIGSSIYQNQTVFFKPKTYERDGYVSFSIEISVAQLYKIKSFCRHHMEHMTPFNVYAMYGAYLPVQLIDTDGTFCSKHVTQALQHANVSLVHGINPALTTPSSLYKRLKANKPIVQLIPVRMNPMARRADDDDHDDDDDDANRGQFVFTFPMAATVQDECQMQRQCKMNAKKSIVFPNVVISALSSQQGKPNYCGPSRYGDITQSAV
jgi:hypothetical protein